MLEASPAPQSNLLSHTIFRIPTLPCCSRNPSLTPRGAGPPPLKPVAGIITTLAKDSLGELLLHPGHATVGVYYLARRHQVGGRPTSLGCAVAFHNSRLIVERFGLRGDVSGPADVEAVFD
jgi:hypothetical protein